MGLATDLTRFLGDVSGAVHGEDVSSNNIAALASGAQNREELNSLLVRAFEGSVPNRGPAGESLVDAASRGVRNAFDAELGPDQAAAVVQSLDGRRLRWLAPPTRRLLIQKLQDGGRDNGQPRFAKELGTLGHPVDSAGGRVSRAAPDGNNSGLAQLLKGIAPNARKT